MKHCGEMKNNIGTIYFGQIGYRLTGRVFIQYFIRCFDSVCVCVFQQHSYRINDPLQRFKAIIDREDMVLAVGNLRELLGTDNESGGRSSPKCQPPRSLQHEKETTPS